MIVNESQAWEDQECACLVGGKTCTSQVYCIYKVIKLTFILQVCFVSSLFTIIM
jgi:hypothetical protein